MRGLRALVPVALAVALLGGCATGSEPGGGTTGPPSDGPPTEEPPPTQGGETSLTIVLDETGQGSTQTFTLTCDPAGGDHPDPEAACDALDDAGGADAFTWPRDEVCTEIYGGPQTAQVEGTVDGTPVRADFSRHNGCEISRWDALAPLLGSPGGV